MARRTKGLPVGAIPEQALVALMRLDVIDKGGRPTASAASRILFEERQLFAFPFAGVSTLASGRALGIVPGLALAGATLLAFAPCTTANDLAARADARRLRRYDQAHP